MFPFFSLSLHLQRKIGKETALRDRPCEAGPLRIPLGRGAFAHKKVQRLHAHGTIGTTRLPNGGSFGFVSVPMSHPHGLLLTIRGG